jgi:REP element-mobilizing transposase RayT
MASRLLRLEFAGGVYHVINRGNYRRSLFTGKGAAEAFERTLGEAAERFSWRVHAYVVMSNHFHVALELTEPNLGSGMKWLQGTWIRRSNGFRRLVGRPFQGRYKALVIEHGEALARVCHYIHLNPVRAGIVVPAQADRYPWSSLPKFVSGTKPTWLDPTTVLAAAGGLPDTAEGWRRYGNYLEYLACDETAQSELIAAKLSRGWCVGGEEFKQTLREQARQKGWDLARERFAGLEPEHAVAELERGWEERLQALARAAGADLSKLPTKKSAETKVRLAAALKTSTSVSNGWLARRLGMGAPASASQFVRRWLMQDRRRSETAALLSRVKT